MENKSVKLNVLLLYQLCLSNKKSFVFVFVNVVLISYKNSLNRFISQKQICPLIERSRNAGWRLTWLGSVLRLRSATEHSLRLRLGTECSGTGFYLRLNSDGDIPVLRLKYLQNNGSSAKPIVSEISLILRSLRSFRSTLAFVMTYSLIHCGAPLPVVSLIMWDRYLFHKCGPEGKLYLCCLLDFSWRSNTIFFCWWWCMW